MMSNFGHLIPAVSLIYLNLIAVHFMIQSYLNITMIGSENGVHNGINISHGVIKPISSFAHISFLDH